MKVSIGRYVPGNSLFHRMDPRVKFIGNVLFLVLFFIVQDFVAYFILLVPVTIAFLISTRSFKSLFRILRLPLYIGVFLFIINMWIISPTDVPANLVYGHWWNFTISYVAITRTLSIILRVYALIMVTTILTYTTKPVLLTIAIEDILMPLKLIKFPVQIISMIISITLRFIPTLIDEASRIMKAQASRGVDFKNGNFKSKIKSTITLIIPLFVSAFAKADELANAMEARGYDPYAKRSRYKKLSLTYQDILMLFVFAAFIALVVIDTSYFHLLPDWWQLSIINPS